VIYSFEECTFDTRTRDFTRSGELQHLEPQVIDVLEYLVRNRDRLVTKIDLLDNVWGDRFVSESALTSRIKSVRRACGDTGREQRIVRTAHGRGYRFVADVTEGTGAPESERRPDPVPVASVSSRVVGRSPDLGELESVLSAASVGARQSAFVTGPPGVGKSTVTAELIERIDDPDAWLVLRGQCLLQRGGAEPYFAVLDALSHAARAGGEEIVEVLERFAPSWLSQMPSLLDDDRAARLERRLLGATEQRMLREGVEAIEGLAAIRPLVLLLEDLHWADGWTLDVLELVTQRSEPASILVLGTARSEPGPAADLIGRLATAGRAVEVSLDGLDGEAMASLVSDLFDGGSVPAELVELIVRRSGGIPLFVNEIVTTWLRQGLVTVDAGLVVAHAAPDEMEATLPQGVRQLIERQLGRVDPQRIAVLEAASVVGTVFDGAATAAGLDRPLAEVEELLVAMGRELPYLVPMGGSSWPDGTVSTRFSFTHDLYRSAVYERISASTRAELHGAIGRSIEAGYCDQIDEQVPALATHFANSGDAAQAVSYLRRAGVQAAARSADGAAVRHLLDALDRVMQLPAGLVRDQAELEVRIALGPSLVATRGWFGEEVSENYERAMQLCDDSECVYDESALARYGLATVTELRGEYERTAELLVPLVGGPVGDLRVEACELMACSAFHQGDFDLSFEMAMAVLDVHEEGQDSELMARLAEHPESAANSWGSLSAWGLGRSEESLDLAQRAVDAGRSHLYALSTALEQRALLHQLRNEPDECRRWAEAAVQVAEEHGFPLRTMQGRMHLGWVQAVTGEPEAGADLLAATMRQFRLAGVRLNVPYFLVLEAEARLLAGDLDAAFGLVDEAREILRATTRRFFFEPEIDRFEARLHLASGEPGRVDAARNALERASQTAELMGSPVLMLRAGIDRLRLEGEYGDPDPWERTISTLLDRYHDVSGVSEVVEATELLADR